MNTSYLNQNEYTPVGDIAVIALCMIVGVLLLVNKVHKSSGFKLMLGMVLTLVAAAMANIIYRTLIGADTLSPVLIYVFRVGKQTSLSAVQILYILYLREPLWMNYESYKRFFITAHFVGIVPVLVDIAGIVWKFTFYVENNITVSKFTIYPFGFVAFVGVIFYLIIHYRNRIIKQVFLTLMATNTIAFVLTAVQGMHSQTSFTTFTYFLPVLGLLFVFHSTPYDAETGAATDTFFYRELATVIEKNQPLVMISCTINDFYNRMKASPELRRVFFRFFKQNIKRGVLYRFPNGRMILTLRKTSDKETFESNLNMMLGDFYKLHSMMKLDYKLVIAETVPELTSAEEYTHLIDFVESDTGLNTTHIVSEDDIKRFCRDKYILSELEDIAKKHDLNDERVLVYCQPVFNIITGTYDTAEALMRLRLPEKGMVFPDQFIPIAEKYNLIHILSMVILNKTCQKINELLNEGYILNRISVNFSTIDLRYDNFVSEVQSIIDSNDIPYGKIAVEITESRSEMEFNRMKQQVTELQELGIKFYLDDFGTGYSNFERIMEIPFDIIKFDRSLLLESAKSDSSRFMVSTFASMFNDLKYSVLFEGVENDRDEAQCRDMHASYLQGYKYSKPIPIEDLCGFLQKAAG